jgi:HSP20 family protein
MADTKIQTPTTDPQGSILRRQEYPPSRDYNFNPFAMMRRFSDEMDRNFWQRILGDASAWNPAVEVRERNGNLEIDAELPGINKEDVKVEATNEGIVIEGEKKREFETTDGGYHRTERSYGHFYRVVALPEGAELDKARAEFRNGVLQIRVPFSRQQQQRRGRQIPIAA